MKRNDSSNAGPDSGWDKGARSTSIGIWVGRVLSGMVTLLLLFSAIMKLIRHEQVLEGINQFGFPESVVMPLGIVELACTILYWIPMTASIGAILLTGYLGGAVVTHLRVGEPWFMPIVIGVIIWIGLVLRQPRLAILLPWKSS